MWTVTVLICAFMVAAGVSQETEEDWRDVTLTQGTFRGFKAPNYDAFQFLNVPYASAPTGRNRFKAPLEPPVWSGIHNATDRRIACPQAPSIITLFLNIQEDCLVANIYVPNTNQTNLPVMVMVHGGAYLIGWGSAATPNGLVSSKNIIVVTFNYRLGPHGFLCLGTEDVPGNAGMKDQVAALQWVKKNIARFGGNPDDVTISGCSAGGSAVDLLLISNMTDGLFNKVISESGCSVNTFSAQLDPLQNARNHALQLGFTNVTNLNALEEFYKSTPVNDIFNNLNLDAKDSYFFFQPCVEKNIGQPRFLEDAPSNILKKGDFKKLPVIYGYAKQEGIFRLPEFQRWSILMNENFTDFLPADLQFENETQKVEVARQVKQFYFGDQMVSNDTVLEYVDYFTDVLFLSGILRNIALRVKAGHNDVFLYEYSFTHNHSQTIPHTDGLRGATHCDQFEVIMDHPFPSILSEERINMSLTMRDIIYNFIATGNPTPNGSDTSLPTWPPVGADRSPHYSVGDTIEVAGIPAERRALLWDAIYERYGATPQPPIDTSTEDPTAPDEDAEPIDSSTVDPTTPDEDAESTDTTTEDPTTPDDAEPNSATLNAFYSYRFWIMFTIVVTIAFK